MKSNELWLAQLRDPAQRDGALGELRLILHKGLQRGLVETTYTNMPEFEALTEDFVQESLLRILDHLDSFQGESQFTTWAYKIAVRVALTELRRKKWQDYSLEGLTESADKPWQFADGTPTPEQSAERNNALALIQTIIDEELTEKQRIAIQHLFITGMPIEEAARRMEMNRNALYKLVYDARQRLKQKVTERGLTAEQLWQMMGA